MIRPVWTNYHSRFRCPDIKGGGRVLLLVFFVFLFLLPPLPVFAAKRRVIFQLANLRHWVDLSYQYTGGVTDNKVGSDRSSQEHELEQVYHFGIDYAILSRRLANGTLEIDLGTNQAISRESSSEERNDKDAGLGLEYLFDMVLFERRPYPVTLVANRVQQRINAPFAENYTLTNSNYSSGLAVRHDLFPFQLSYRYVTSETSGLRVDRNQNSDELLFESTLRWWDFSETHLRGRISSTETDFDSPNSSALSTDSYDLSGQNLLIWGQLERRNTLNSRYQLRKDSGSSQLSSVQWAENLELQLGKGLTVGGEYSYDKNDVLAQKRVEHKNRGWIEHRLYKSLSTRFSYTGSDVEYLNGTDQSFRGQAGINYKKRLPKNSSFTFSYSYGYGEIDRNLSDQNMFVPLEARTVDAFNTVTLDTPQIDQASVVLYADDLKTPYLGAYTVNLVGNDIKIFIPGAIPGDIVYVEYSHQINNSIEYSTSSHAISAAVGLFNQRFRVYSTVNLSDQELIDGSDEVSPLTQQTFAQLGVEGNFEKSSFSTSYIYLDTSFSTDKTLETYFSHLQEIGRNLLSLRLTDRYSIIRQKEGLLTGSSAGSADKSNSLMFNIDYRKPLRRNTTLSLRGQLLDIRGQQHQNDLSIGGTLESRWYKFELLFNADVAWTLMENTVSREDLLSVKLRRYF